MQKAERELIDEKFKSVHTKLDLILLRNKETEKKVDLFGKHTRVVRLLESKPIFLALIVLGIIFVASFLDVKDFIKLF